MEKPYFKNVSFPVRFVAGDPMLLEQAKMPEFGVWGDDRLRDLLNDALRPGKICGLGLSLSKEGLKLSEALAVTLG